MALNNCLTVKTHLSELKINSDKDTASEVSIVSIIHISVELLITHLLQIVITLKTRLQLGHFDVRHFGNME